MMPSDKKYSGIPWRAGGRDWSGVDCVGLVELWLRNEMGWEGRAPGTPPSRQVNAEDWWQAMRDVRHRGDVVFWRKRKSGKVCHVSIYLGDGFFLNILNGCASRIEGGTKLMERLGFQVLGALDWREAVKPAGALQNAKLGEAATLVMIIIAIVAAVASAFLAPKPKLGKFGNSKGRYSGDALVTQTSPEVPLPDILGEVTVAGNAPYTSLPDKSTDPDDIDPLYVRVNKVLVLCSGPATEINTDDYEVKINGMQLNNPYWYDTVSLDGFTINPAQSYDEAVMGNIGGTTARAPSVTKYDGAYGITVPVDVRAEYDRNMPVYGFSGCAYLVFRLIGSAKYPSFNAVATVRGRTCRTFDDEGFIRATATSESLTGADGTKVRFKLAHEDIESVTSLSVGVTAYTQISADDLTGDLYHLNATKGYVEFLTAPANGASITITYVYFVRAWSDNPTAHLVYLLTEKHHGKGYPESKIDWAAADAMFDYCAESVSWYNSQGSYSQARFRCSYALDFRKPIQEHIQAVLDCCRGVLLLSQGKFVMLCRQAGSSVMTFDDTNILADSFSASQLDRAEQSNRVRLFYHGEESLNSETEAMRESKSDQDSRLLLGGTNGEGVVESQLKVPAVTDLVQAEMLAQVILDEELSMGWVCEFTTTCKGLALQPLDIITITPSLKPDWVAKLFRVESLSYDEMDRLRIRASEYTDIYL